MNRTKAILALVVLAAGLISSHGTYAESLNVASGALDPGRTFKAETITEFDMPWAIAFLPDGRLIVTEEKGKMFLVGPQGNKTEVANVPNVFTSRGDGLLDIAPSPDFAQSSAIFFSYIEPQAGGRLVLARAVLSGSASRATLENLEVIWRQNVSGGGVHTGGVIAFDPQGSRLFITIGDFSEPDSAQNPEQARGKILRLNLDGSTPQDNPNADEGGIRAQTWTTGHRNPYGLGFTADGQLWSHEMGPRGGDEMNLIERGKNYGWPLVSEGDDYSGSSIPDHKARPDLAAPSIHWSPVISPAGLAFYHGKMFPRWRGSALVGGLSAMSLIRVSFEQGQPEKAQRWDVGERIRDVAVAPDGAVWIVEDSSPGRLLRLTPSR